MNHVSRGFGNRMSPAQTYGDVANLMFVCGVRSIVSWSSRSGLGVTNAKHAMRSDGSFFFGSSLTTSLNRGPRAAPLV